MSVAYSDLTEEQRSTIATTEHVLRPTIGQAIRVLAAMQAVYLDYLVNTKPIMDQLGETEVIPNTTGLAGAQPLTVAEFRRLIGSYQTLVASYVNDAQAAADQLKAAGVNAILGQ